MGRKFFFLGDAESAKTIGEIKDIDYAFIPIWILDDAKEKNIKINTKIRVIYHIYPKEKFVGDIPSDVIILKNQDEIITIPY